MNADPIASRWAACLGALVLIISLAPGCSPVDKTPLPAGYSIFMVSNSEIFLEEPKYGGSIPELGTDLLAIGSHNEFIFGLCGTNRNTKPGYFLLDTRTGKLRNGLQETNWVGLVAEAGIPVPAPLVNPRWKRPLKR